MGQLTLTLLGLLAISLTAAQNDPHFVDGRNTIVHLFEWKWSDIANECETFLSKNKYAGVQIPPPSENVAVNSPYRPWWERYQPVSYQLNTRSGNENALADMIKRCNNVGIRIYADLVVNHMAAQTGSGTAGSSCNPGSKYYPAVSYSNENFHQSCDINYSDAASIRNCELEGLKDLDQSQEYVRGKIRDYMNHLISLGVAGFRVDAAKHMWPADLQAIFSSVNNLNTQHGFQDGARPYIYQEVIDTGNDAVSNTEYVGTGRLIEFKVGDQLGRCFQGQNALAYLENWGTGWGLLQGSQTLQMIDNHDTQRNGGNVLNYKNAKPYKAAIAFMMAHPYEGNTQVLSSYKFDSSDDGPPNNNGDVASPTFGSDGSCQNGWVCEHRWSEIFHMVEFRSVVKGTSLVHWWTNGQNQIAFGRDGKGFVAFTVGGDINQTLQTGLPAGTYCDVISGRLDNGKCTGKTVVVDGSGNAQINLSEGDFDAALAIHVNAKQYDLNFLFRV